MGESSNIRRTGSVIRRVITWAIVGAIGGVMIVVGEFISESVRRGGGNTSVFGIGLIIGAIAGLIVGAIVGVIVGVIVIFTERKRKPIPKAICTGCGQEVDRWQSTCPNCGTPVEHR